MPLVFIKDIDTDTRLGLWKIADELHADEVCPQMVCEELKRKCARRQKENAAVYALLHAMTGRKDLVIGHNTDGKPTLDGYIISVSHTIGYASIIMSKTRNVAVDVEYRNDRVFRIVDKFLTKQETALLSGLLQTKDAISKTSDIASHDNSNVESHDAQTALLLCWCAKETIYKYFSEEKLMFDEMQTCLEEIEQEGTFYCSNLRQDIKKTITYMQNEEFVLTYTL